MKASQTGVKPRDWPIEQLPGLSDRDREGLSQCGIRSTGQLLQQARTPEARLNLAKQLHLHIQYLNKWVALADLAAIPSVGCQYCGLLLHSGVASSKQLAQLPAHRLHQQISRLQVSMTQQKEAVSMARVARWIQEAKSIDR
ncbi:MAG: DUF4332 domain-containing protein [Oscillatoria sp. SIO1A7]|nr:DUF4332 domain-containing protein [Oscillatoria sp. SIO1A7]